MRMKKFWEFKTLAEKKGELYLYGEISDALWWGDEVTPAAFRDDLAALGEIETLDIFINSPGGDFFAGMAIYNMLNRHKAEVVVHIDGIAASAASLIAMVGDKVIMPKNATMMIHNAWSCFCGDKTEMRKLADELERIDGQQASIYSQKTGKKEPDILAWMAEERWMNGAEAVKDGFADELSEPVKIAACADAEKYFAVYHHPPKIETDLQEAIRQTDGVPMDEPEETADSGGISSPETADNGEEDPQPVADKDAQDAPVDQPEALQEQRSIFDRIKNKLLEV